MTTQPQTDDHFDVQGWMPVMLSQDVVDGSAAPAQRDAQDLVVWRTASGRISAWADRCPHRGMRLSHGFVRGDFLSCIYHGWRYAGDGQCHKIPAHPGLTPPDAIRANVFAVAEASGVVWVGAEREPPAAPPPDFAGFSGFRSLRLAAPATRLAHALGAGGSARLVRLGPCEVVALIQPLRDGASALHLLAPADAGAETLDALSMAAEALRRRVETGMEGAA